MRIITAAPIHGQADIVRKEDVQYWHAGIEAKLFGLLWFLLMNKIIWSTKWQDKLQFGGISLLGFMAQCIDRDRRVCTGKALNSL